MFRAAGLSAPAWARAVLLRSRPGAPLGAESLRGRASPFGVPSAALRLARLLAPRPRRRNGHAVGLRPSSLRLPSPPGRLFEPGGGGEMA